MANPDQNSMKQAAAESAVRLVRDGMILGLGTGSTADFALRAIGRRVKEGLRIAGIPSSEQTAAQARELGIPLVTFADHERIDLTIDGADEVAPGALDLIKGHGGALLREKIVASASLRLIIILDDTKLVERLGARMRLPVEVIPFGWEATARQLLSMGLDPVLRLTADARPFVSDGGHSILDCSIRDSKESAAALASELDRMVGVVEHGFFLGMATEVHVGGPGGVRILKRTES